MIAILFIVKGFEKIVVEQHRDVGTVHCRWKIEVLLFKRTHLRRPVLHLHELHAIGMVPPQSGPYRGIMTHKSIRNKLMALHFNIVSLSFSRIRYSDDISRNFIRAAACSPAWLFERKRDYILSPSIMLIVAKSEFVTIRC